MGIQPEIDSSGNGFFRLLGALIGDARTLIRQELRLLRDEWISELVKVRQAAVSLGLGIGLVAIGGLFALIMLVQVLHTFVHLPLWACYGAIGIVLLIGGVSLLLKATQSFRSFNLTPRRTLHSVKEDAQWIKEQVSLNKT